MSKPEGTPLGECLRHNTHFDSEQPCWACINEFGTPKEDEPPEYKGLTIHDIRGSLWHVGFEDQDKIQRVWEYLGFKELP